MQKKELIEIILRYLILPLIIIYITYVIIKKFLPINNNDKIIIDKSGILDKKTADYYAGQLYSAMCNMGTNTKTIDEIYNKIVNDPYILKDIANAFGVKPYLLFGGSYTIPFINMTLGEEYNLQNWLRAELNDKDYNKWQKLFDLIGY